MSSALKRKLKGKRPPAGWDMIEDVVEDFEQQLKDAVAEEQVRACTCVACVAGGAAVLQLLHGSLRAHRRSWCAA
jgi:hypothetical protein